MAYHQFPNLVFNLENQFDKVEVRAKFATDYYLPSGIAEATLAAAPTVRPKYNGQPGFAVEVVKIYDSIADYLAGIYVDLNWRKLPDVATDAPYTLWRAEANGDGSDAAIIQDWAEVVLTREDYIGTSPVEPRIRVKDNTVEVGKYYAYILVVTGNNGGEIRF